MTAGPRAGAIADGATRLFHVYDAWNRLVEVWEDTNDDGDKDAEGTDTQLIACEYDGLNRRVAKTDKTGESDVAYDYYYNTSWQILEIRKNDDADPLKQYIWNIQYIDAPVCYFYDGDTDGSGVVEYYMTWDANYNVTAIVPTTVVPAERYAYDPYGSVTILDSGWTDDADQVSDVDNDVLFCGYRFDPETGLYQVRYRYLNPRFGWITRDPKDQNLPGGGYHDGMNLYEYCMSGPISFVDPMGLGRTEEGNVDDYFQWAEKQNKETRALVQALRTAAKDLEEVEYVDVDNEDAEKGKGREKLNELMSIKSPMSGKQRILTIHELDKDGNPKVDEKGRVIVVDPHYVWVDYGDIWLPNPDPCRIYLYIGHSIDEPADIVTGKRMFEENEHLKVSGAGVKVTIDPTTGEVKHEATTGPTPTVGVATCFAKITTDSAEKQGYYTLKPSYGIYEKAPGTPRVRDENKLNIQASNITLIEAATTLFIGAKRRAAELHNGPCEKVCVIVIWGHHKWEQGGG